MTSRSLKPGAIWIHLIKSSGQTPFSTKCMDREVLKTENVWCLENITSPGFTKVYISLDSIWMCLLLDMNIHLNHSEICVGSLFLQLNISDWKWLCFINLHYIPATLHWADPCWADLGLDLTLDFFFVQVRWRSGHADKRTALCRTFQAWLTTGITVGVGTELWGDTARQPSHLLYLIT